MLVCIIIYKFTFLEDIVTIFFFLILQLIMESQDDQIDRVADSVGVLKNMSHSIGNELDEQAV